MTSRIPTDMVADRTSKTKLSDTLGSMQTSINTNTSSLAEMALIVKSTGSDDTTNINNAINTVSQAGGGKVLLPDPTYSALGIQLKSNVILEGYETTINKNGGTSGTHVIESLGSVTGISNPLSADVAVGATSVTASNITGINIGDYVLVRDTTYIVSPWGRNQEIARVLSVTSTTVTFTSPLIGSYTVANTSDVIKITPVINARMRGIRLSNSTGGNGGLFKAVLNIGLIVEKCTALQPNDNAGFWIDQSYNCRLCDCIVKDGQNVSTAGYGYGYFIGDSSHHCFVEDCYSENVRENPISYRVRYSGFLNCTAKGHYDDGFNTHGTGNDHIYIKGNWIINSKALGIAVGYSTHVAGDSNIWIEDNHIINAQGRGIAIVSPSSGSLNAQNIYLKNNKIKNVGVNGSNAYGIMASYVTDMVVSDNDIDGQGNNNAQYGMVFTSVTNLKTESNKVFNLTNGYGIYYQTNCANVQIERNRFENILNSNITSDATSTNVTVRDNVADDTLQSFTSNIRTGNIWGAKKDRDDGAYSAGDGNSIPHNCVGNPRVVKVAGTVAGQIVTVGTIASTYFTVAVKTSAGAAGTVQTIYWEAEV